MQGIKDQIVERYFADEEDEACTVYLANLEQLESNGPDYQFTGTLIPDEHLEFNLNYPNTLKRVVTAERFEALYERGAKPTEEEELAFRAAIIEDVKKADFDADLFPGYYIPRLRHSDGREIFALMTIRGYSFSGVEIRFQGLFPSVKAAVEYLETRGVVLADWTDDNQ